MGDDDMTHMRDVFLKRLLPYAEYLTDSGYHDLSRDVIKKSPNESAMRQMMDKYGEHFMAIYQIPRPNGIVTKVSVISGMMFYSRKDAPYEVLVHQKMKDNEPIGHQTDEDLMILIAKLLGESDGV